MQRAAAAIVYIAILCGLLAAPRQANAVASPTLIGHASTPALAGGTMSDSATLAAGAAPTGTITFQLFNNSGVIFTSMKAVSGNGLYTSDPYGPLTDSTFYTWQATYGGDANNASASTVLFGGAESISVPEYCPPHACSTIAGSCMSGTIGATSSTFSCKGLPPRVTVVTVSIVGPANICDGADKSLVCSILAGGIEFNTITETVVDEIFADGFEGT